MSEQKFPPGWNAERVERLLAHYETISEEEQVAEDEESENNAARQNPDSQFPTSEPQSP